MVQVELPAETLQTTIEAAATVEPTKPRFLLGCKICQILRKKYDELPKRSAGRRIVRNILARHWARYHQPQDGKFVYGATTNKTQT
jgi:hypothetical protein